MQQVPPLLCYAYIAIGESSIEEVHLVWSGAEGVLDFAVFDLAKSMPEASTWIVLKPGNKQMECLSQITVTVSTVLATH